MRWNFILKFQGWKGVCVLCMGEFYTYQKMVPPVRNLLTAGAGPGKGVIGVCPPPFSKQKKKNNKKTIVICYFVLNMAIYHIH